MPTRCPPAARDCLAILVGLLLVLGGLALGSRESGWQDDSPAPELVEIDGETSVEDVDDAPQAARRASRPLRVGLGYVPGVEPVPTLLGWPHAPLVQDTSARGPPVG